MILTQTAVYALNAVLHLAEAPQGEPVRVEDMAAALDVPRNYLSKVLNVLAREGLLTSVRGPKGGFSLARDPAGILLADVILHFDDTATASGCLLGRARCSDLTPCAAHARWRGVAGEVRAFLNQTTVEDLSSSGAGLYDVSAG